MEMEAERPRLQRERDFLGIQRLTSEEIVSEAESLLIRREDFPFSERQTIVEAMVERVMVGKDEIDLEPHPPYFFSNRGKRAAQNLWCVPPSSPFSDGVWRPSNSPQFPNTLPAPRAPVGTPPQRSRTRRSVAGESRPG